MGVPFLSKEDQKAYDEYKKGGGTLGWARWMDSGKPAPEKPTDTAKNVSWFMAGNPEEVFTGDPGMGIITYKAYKVMLDNGLPISPDVKVAMPSPGEMVTAAQAPEQEAQSALEELMGGIATSWDTISEGGWDYQVGYDKEGNIVSKEPLGRTEVGEKYPSYAQPEGDIPTDQYGRKATWDVDNAEWRYPPDWNVNPATLEEGYVSPQEQYERERAEREAAESRRRFEENLGIEQKRMTQDEMMQQQMINWYREQSAAEMAAEKQALLAKMMANPASWLEYAGVSGQPAAIQPWMMPLMPEQYSGLKVGQEIPGFNVGGSSKGMPELINPSAQYMARIAPSAREQYKGYQTARTGQTAEDVDWRLWSQAPPGSSIGSLSYRR